MDKLLSDKHIYQKLEKDRTPAYKGEFIGMIRKWQNEDPISLDIKYKIYPTTEEGFLRYTVHRNPQSWRTAPPYSI